MRFADTIRLLTTDGTRALVEVGPGHTLTGLVQALDLDAVAVPTLSRPQHRRDDAETLVSAVGRIWTEGVDVDWSRWWTGERRLMVTLPPYPYQRQRYWIEPDQPTGTAPVTDPTVNDPFTTPVWTETAPLPAGPVSGVWAVLADPADPYLARTAALAREAGVTVLTAGSARDLVDRVANLDGPAGPVTVVHGLTVGGRPGGVGEAGYAGQWLERGFLSLLEVAQEFTRRLPTQVVDLVAVSSDMQDVAGDGRVEPAKAAVLGVVKVAPKEFEALTCRSIDIGGDGQIELSARQLVAEIARGVDAQVAYRGRKRWTWSFTGMAVDAPPGTPALLKQRGVYVVTGGLGGLGLRLGRYLGETVAARLAVLTPRPLPDRDQWPSILSEQPDSQLAGRVRGIMAAEAAGAEVLVVPADVTDATALRAAAATVRERFGPVDGVFHLAAVAGGAMLETRQRQDAARVLAPKVAGTYLLEEVFDPPLMVLYSTIAVFSADFGLGDYVGANAVLDAYAQSRHGTGRHVLSVNWPPFDDVGMAAVIVAPSVLTGVPSSAPDTAAGAPPAGPASAGLVPVAHPMLLGRDPASTGPVRFEVNLAPQLWVLAEHRLGGVPTMPGTGVIELIRAGYQEVTGRPSATIGNVVFQRPLRVLPAMRAWLELAPDGTGGYDAALTVGAEVYARGHVGAGPAEAAAPMDATAARAGFAEVAPPELGNLVTLAFGPRWRTCIQRRWSGPGSEVVELALGEEFRADLSDYAVHPAALDCAVALGQIVAGTGSYLPFSYEEVSVHGPLPARFCSVIRHRDDTTGDLTTADIWLVDEDGRVVVAVRGFSALRVDNAFTDQPADITVTTPSTPDSIVTSELGTEALRQLLGARVGPQVMWCPEGLAVRMRRSAGITRASIAAQVTAQTGGVGPVGGERSLNTEYVAPSGDVEVALAGLWSQTLGVERIGAEDDFFDLGGNSLFAVQLVSRISERFSIEASAALLFDSRSIRTLAAAIEQLLLAKVASLTEEEAAAVLHSRALQSHPEVAGVR